MDNIKDSQNPDFVGGEDKNPVQVFCRLRRSKTSAGISSAQIKNFDTLLLPGAQANLNSGHETHYKFKQVFDEYTSQDDIFNVVGRPLVERLIRGCNSLLFTYGVTGSGKTYTMTGMKNQCGILPRCLKAIIETIAGHRAQKGTFKSDHLNGFELIEEKEEIVPVRSARYMTALRRKNSDPEIDLHSIGPVQPVSGINERNIYAIFVSYIEIYNNSVYDLLEESISQKPAQSHIVREDGNHNMYIHGTTELEINSVQEAIEAFQAGQKRKRTGQTALNAESSRSHAVFNIRLVQAPSKEHAAADASSENLITISQLSLVDLAGSERSSRTQNTGARLREAGNINNSLMKLRECLAYLRENQQNPNGSALKKIPYRDSRLTYLFKNFFEGEGQVTMIVCLNPNANDNLENEHVLKFAEMTQEVQILDNRTTPLCSARKRLAWAIELPETGKETPRAGSEMVKRKRIAFSCEKPTGNGQYVMLKQKITTLEKQNLELRLELERIQIAYEKITGHPFLDAIEQQRSAKVLATMRKPLPPSPLTSNFKNFRNVATFTRKATEEESFPFKDVACSTPKGKENQSLNVSKLLRTPKSKLKMPVTNIAREREASPLNAMSIKSKINIFNEISTMTQKSCKSFIKNSPFKKDFDDDFDRRELELSIKIENHHKNQRANKRLMDVLQSTLESPTPAKIQKTSIKKNLFSGPNVFCDEES